MSAETSSDGGRGDTYVGFDLNDPEHKRQLKIEAAKRDYSSMAAFVRDVIYQELDLEEASDDE